MEFLHHLEPVLAFIKSHPVEVAITVFVVGAKYLGWSPKWMFHLTRTLYKVGADEKGGRAVFASLLVPLASALEVALLPAAAAAGLERKSKKDEVRFDRYFDGLMDVHRKQERIRTTNEGLMERLEEQAEQIAYLRAQIKRRPSFDEFTALEQEVDKLLGRSDPRSRDA